MAAMATAQPLQAPASLPVPNFWKVLNGKRAAPSPAPTPTPRSAPGSDASPLEAVVLGLLDLKKAGTSS